MRTGIYFNRNYISENRVYIELIKKTLICNNVDCRFVIDATDLDGLDILFVLGGDGTILNIASDCAERAIKIVGINYGHLGFLTEFEPSQVNEALDCVFKGKYTVIKRSMLEVSYGDKSYSALNDLVIQRSTSGNHFSNIVRLRAEINGSVVDDFASDGLIVCTPTGSTAYSLSAGGSVLTPDLNAFAITSICAHSLHSRPVVYSDKSVLKVYPHNNSSPLTIIVDGRIVDQIDDSVEITVKKSEHFVEFISRGNENFFEKLFIKLNIWSK